MSDQERIRAMRDAGKLSPEEAERLLAALQDIATAENDLNAAEESLYETNREGSEAAAERAAPSPVKDTARDEGLNWVRVSLLAGDIDAFVDASLSEPSVLKGRAEVQREGNDFIIRAARRIDEARMTESRRGFGNFLDEVSDLVSSVSSRFGDIKLALPAGYALEVDSKAGDVDVKDVPFLKARLMAGDIDAVDVGGIDIAAGAGDIDVRFRPTAGRHRVQAAAGDVDIQLLEGSSVELEASVNIGDIDLSPKSQGGVAKRGLGGSVSKRVGTGAARLEVLLSTGDLDITLP